MVSSRKLTIVFYRTGRHGGDDDGRSPQVAALRDGLVGEGHEAVAASAAAVLRRRPGSRHDAARPDAAQPDVVVVGGTGEPGCLEMHLTRLRWSRCLVVLLRPDPVGDDHDEPHESHESHEHDEEPSRSARRQGIGPLRARLRRAALRRADLVVETRLPPQTTAPAPVPFDDHKTVVVPVGAGAAWFAAAARRRTRPEAAYDHGPLRVVHFAGYASAQHTATVGETIGQLSDEYVEWTMVGTSDDRRRIEAMTSGTGKVIWIDPASIHDLPGLVAEHDLALGRFDAEPAFRWEVIQAMAAGCAVVTATNDAVARVVGAAATFVPPAHPRALASVLTALAVDPDHLAVRRAVARRAAEAFTPAAVVAPLAARLADSPDIPF